MTNTTSSAQKFWALDWIESFAFENCSNLENVVFGKKTYFIKKCAFRNCDKITRLRGEQHAEGMPHQGLPACLCSGSGSQLKL